MVVCCVGVLLLDGFHVFVCEELMKHVFAINILSLLLVFRAILISGIDFSACVCGVFLLSFLISHSIPTHTTTEVQIFALHCHT